MTVHIVEDDDGVRDALSELCKSVGRKVRLYPDGETFGAGADVSPLMWFLSTLACRENTAPK